VVHRDEPVELHHERLERIEELQHLVAPPLRHVERDAADAVIVEREPRAAELLDEVVDVLALAERPRERRDGADIHRHRSEGDHVARDAVELARDRAEILRALRHLDPHELLARGRPALVGEHGSDVVDAIGVRHVARVRAALADLLDAAMQVADVGDGLPDDLAVARDDEPEDAVRGRMVGTHVEVISLIRW
jgi:phage tail protein X